MKLLKWILIICGILKTLEVVTYYGVLYFDASVFFLGLVLVVTIAILVYFEIKNRADGYFITARDEFGKRQIVKVYDPKVDLIKK